MTTIRGIIQTQKISVDNPRNAVSTVNAGPAGPAGPQGVSNVLTVLTADGQLLTRASGALAPITRANLAADSAFTSRYLELADFTADGQLMTRVAGVVTPITRAALATDTAFSSIYPKRTTGAGAPSGTGSNGEEYYDTTNKRLYRSDGVGWIVMAEPTQSFTPTVKCGTTTLSIQSDSRYKRSDGWIDELVQFRVTNMNAAVGLMTITHAKTAKMSTNPAASYLSPYGSALCIDVSVGVIPVDGVPTGNDAGGLNFVIRSAASAWAQNYPFSWVGGASGTGDEFFAALRYEMASPYS